MLFVDTQLWILKVFQRAYYWFKITPLFCQLCPLHYTCHLLSCLHEAFKTTVHIHPKMVFAVFAKMLENFQSLTRVIPKAEVTSHRDTVCNNTVQFTSETVYYRPVFASFLETLINTEFWQVTCIFTVSHFT